MLKNRSIPSSAVIPVLAYPDVEEAAAWLCEVFQFSVRIRISGHRVQLNVGSGAVILRELRPSEAGAKLGAGCSVTVRVEDVDSHCQRARERGAIIAQEPCTQPYGERQYGAEDLAGHAWTFSQTVSDVMPEDWGGVSGRL